jgi:hypothetical protein
MVHFKVSISKMKPDEKSKIAGNNDCERVERHKNVVNDVYLLLKHRASPSRANLSQQAKII